MKRYYLYIILTRTQTVISKLIHIFKTDEFTHAAISFDKELDHMYSLLKIEGKMICKGNLKEFKLTGDILRINQNATRRFHEIYE